MSTFCHTIDVGGSPRRYLVHTPPDRFSGRLPVIVVLHGAGATADWTLEETDWQTTADREGILIVVPEGMPIDPSRPASFLENPQLWNDGGSPGLLDGSRADDLAFIRAMLDRIEVEYQIDTQRVFVTGFSNGACMTFKLGTDVSERFAALAPVAGHLRLQRPRPAIARPTLYLIGSADPLMPLEGGSVESPWDGKRFERPPVAATLERWSAALGCPPIPAERDGPAGVHISEYGPGRDGATLLVYVFEGLGHHWPGGRGRLNRRIAGMPSDRVRANDLIWDFFQRHKKQS